MKHGYSVALATISIFAVLMIGSRLKEAYENSREFVPSLAGCFLPPGADQSRKVEITKAGILRYRHFSSPVVPYEDKGGLSYLPKVKIVADFRGGLQFREGYPFLLRIDKYSHGFTVPSEEGAWVTFQKIKC